MDAKCSRHTWQDVTHRLQQSLAKVLLFINPSICLLKVIPCCQQAEAAAELLIPIMANISP